MKVLHVKKVFEANAYASEILCKLRFLEGHADENVEVSLRFLESEVNSYLNNKAFSEYSLLLILCKIHFEYLTLKEMLIFFQVLVFRVLNMQIMNLSSLSAFLKRTFKNNHYGLAICKDMQRGMSRHVVVFKLILLVHQFINESSDKLSLIALMKEKPDEVINLMFKYYEINIISELDFGNNSQFYLLLENILNEDNMFDKNIIAESSEFNHKVIKEKGWSKVDLSDLKILDSLLSDGSVIRFPGRVSLDVMKYFDNNIDKFLIIEELFNNTEVSKFHIHPDHVVWV